MCWPKKKSTFFKLKHSYVISLGTDELDLSCNTGKSKDSSLGTDELDLGCNIGKSKASSIDTDLDCNTGESNDIDPIYNTNVSLDMAEDVSLDLDYIDPSCNTDVSLDIDVLDPSCNTGFDIDVLDCNTGESKGEKICRHILQRLFKVKFLNTRPDFLKNPITGYNLELDCYNEILNLGLEYNGKQHYYYTQKFHKNKEAFKCQEYRDYLKKQMCKENNTVLIIVPYTVCFADIETFIRKEIKNINLQLRENTL